MFSTEDSLQKISEDRHQLDIILIWKFCCSFLLFSDFVKFKTALVDGMTDTEFCSSLKSFVTGVFFRFGLCLAFGLQKSRTRLSLF